MQTPSSSKRDTPGNREKEERRKKNAESQRSFRARRDNYVSDLEQTVTALECVVLNLQQSVKEARASGELWRQRYSNSICRRCELTLAVERHSGGLFDEEPSQPALIYSSSSNTGPRENFRHAIEDQCHLPHDNPYSFHHGAQQDGSSQPYIPLDEGPSTPWSQPSNGHSHPPLCTHTSVTSPDVPSISTSTISILKGSSYGALRRTRPKKPREGRTGVHIALDGDGIVLQRRKLTEP